MMNTQCSDIKAMANGSGWCFILIDSAVLRDEYSFITPGWHMNKAHWIKVDVNKCPKDLLDALIEASFNLTLTKRKTK